MKKFITPIFCLTFSLAVTLTAAQSVAANPPTKKKKVATKSAVTKAAKKAAPPVDTEPPLSEAAQRQISEALTLVRAGQCEKAAPLLYNLSKRSDLQKEKFQVKYLLGNCLLELRLYQLTGLERDKITKEYKELLSQIGDLLDIP